MGPLRVEASGSGFSASTLTGDVLWAERVCYRLHGWSWRGSAGTTSRPDRLPLSADEVVEAMADEAERGRAVEKPNRALVVTP